jgi:hypothetical protein
VEFIFVDPKQNDFHNVKTMLKDYLDEHAFNSTEFVDVIVKQSQVGSIIKIDGDDDQSFGFISVVNLHEHKALECVKQIRDYVLTKVGNFHSKWREIFENSTARIGLIVNERLLNVPDALAPHLHLYLYDEIEKAIAEHLPFEFDYYLLLTTCYYDVDDKEEESAESESLQPRKKAVRPKKKRKMPVSSRRSRQYYKFEEEYYVKEAFLVQELTKTKHRTDQQPVRWTIANKFVRECRLFLLLTRQAVHDVLVPQLRAIAPDPNQSK